MMTKKPVDAVSVFQLRSHNDCHYYSSIENFAVELDFGKVVAVAIHDGDTRTFDCCYCCIVIDLVAYDDAGGDYAEVCSL